MNTESQSTGSGLGFAEVVSPGDIEAAFGRMWEQLDDPSDERRVIRACMTNLVVFCPEPSAAATATEAVAGLMGHHPCRVILLSWSDKEGGIEAHLSANCTIASAGNASHVCCEQVWLQAGRDGRERLGWAALPLLIPDLPVVLWSAGSGPPPLEMLSDLMTQVDRVLVDTRTSADPSAAWSVCHRAPGGRTLHCAVSDLTWARLEAWRSGIASLFDGPEVEQLAGLQKVRIQWSSDPKRPAIGRAAAMLIAGWLADRLAWEVQDIAPKGDGFVLGTAGGVKLSAGPAKADGKSAGHLASVSLTAPAGEFRARRSADGQSLLLSRPGGQEQTIPGGRPTTAELLADELEGRAGDRALQSALAVALRVAIEIGGD